MALQCKVCGGPPRYLVGDMTTGAQTPLCEEHYAENPAAGVTTRRPELCEGCEDEPAFLALDLLGTGTEQTLGLMCGLAAMVQLLAAAPAEVRSACLEGMRQTGLLEEQASNGTPRRGRRSHVRLLAEHAELAHGEAGDAGGVAVDEPGPDAELETAEGEED